MAVNPKLGIEVPEPQHLAGIFAELRERIDTLERGTVLRRKGEPDVEIPAFGELVKLAAAARRDGYPASSAAEKSGTGQGDLDEEGFHVAPISDPTGELATAERIIDPIKVHLKTVIRGLTSALGDLRMACTAQASGSQYAEIGPGEARCESCARIGEWSDVYRSERCRWCYDFWLKWRRDAPIDLLRMRIKEGKRITAQMEREAFMPSKSKVHSG